MILNSITCVKIGGMLIILNSITCVQIGSMHIDGFKNVKKIQNGIPLPW